MVHPCPERTTPQIRLGTEGCMNFFLKDKFRTSLSADLGGALSDSRIRRFESVATYCRANNAVSNDFAARKP